MAERLRVLTGVQPGAEIPLGDELVIGRTVEGPGSLGGDREISRLHARIIRRPDGRLAIEDFGSTNGTFLNGWRLTVPQPLTGGDRIQVGGTLLELIVSAP